MSVHPFHEVGNFHRKFGLDSGTYDGYGPRAVSDELLTFRMKFLCEELQEFFEGAGATFPVPLADMVMSSTTWEADALDHAKMFDALIDLVYVAYGTAQLEGYPWPAGWERVQKANMGKERAARDGSNSLRNSSYDVVKPEGWRPPDIEGLLREYGWEI